MKKISYKGSYSVEAALIIPIILGMLFSLLYVLFFLRDRLVLYAEMRGQITGIQESVYPYNREKGEREWEDFLQEHMWVLQVTEADIKVRKKKIEGEAAAESYYAIPVLEIFMAQKQVLNIAVNKDNVAAGDMVWVREVVSPEEKTDMRTAQEGD